MIDPRISLSERGKGMRRGTIGSLLSPGAIFGLHRGGCRVVCAGFASQLSQQNPFDLAQLSIADSQLPPGSLGSTGVDLLAGIGRPGTRYLQRDPLRLAHQPARGDREHLDRIRARHRDRPQRGILRRLAGSRLHAARRHSTGISRHADRAGAACGAGFGPRQGRHRNRCGAVGLLRPHGPQRRA